LPGGGARTTLESKMDVVDRSIVRFLPTVPRSVVQRLSAPYIAGSTLADARRVIAALNAEEKIATVDVLGEEVTSAEEAEAIAARYADVLAVIHEDGLAANVSVKLTALGLEIDSALCERLLGDLAHEAERRRIFVRIDMEDATCTDETLRLYRRLRDDGLQAVGIALQARLRRTLADIGELADLRPNVRLCKGIYVEPVTVAYHGYQEVRDNFVRALAALLEAGCYVALATHDEWLIERGLERLSGLAPDEYEFQMLLGVRQQRASELVADGHNVRVYVPFGDRWYEYSLRRLQENPALAGMLAKATLARLVPGHG
jgi:proline dehydrogenase